MADLAKRWAAQFGQQEEAVQRAALAARLALERRLGEVLAETPPNLIRDENRSGQLQGSEPRNPPGLTYNASSRAQALAKAPQEWFNQTQAIPEAGGFAWQLLAVWHKR